MTKRALCLTQAHAVVWACNDTSQTDRPETETFFLLVEPFDLLNSIKCIVYFLSLLCNDTTDVL